MPPLTPVTEPISTLIGDGEIAARVERLLDDDALASTGRGHTAGRRIALAILAVTIALAYTPLLQIVHNATEVLVRTLP